jgi:hypothetical protein
MEPTWCIPTTHQGLSNGTESTTRDAIIWGEQGGSRGGSQCHKQNKQTIFLHR